jgi:hypothetical protein
MNDIQWKRITRLVGYEANESGEVLIDEESKDGTALTIEFSDEWAGAMEELRRRLQELEIPCSIDYDGYRVYVFRTALAAPADGSADADADAADGSGVR